MRNVLVTGGAGFIGSHLSQRLVSESFNLTVVDNLSRGSLQNLAEIKDKIKFIKGNITNKELIEKLIKDTDVVFHLASLSRVIPSIEEPEKCFEENISGVENIARLCSKYKKMLVFCSSREVYGSAIYTPVDEDHPLNPENPYGASKVCGEKIIAAYSRCYGLSYAILRLANVYGQRDFDRVIPIFVEKTLKNDPLIIYGGNQIIDFVHINDVVDILLKASNSDNNIIANAGSGIGTTLIDLANLIQEISHRTNKIIIREKRRGEVDMFIAKIDYAKKLLKWEPKTGLKEGLSSLLNVPS
jgi:UDP-glucose 4-epimerase